MHNYIHASLHGGELEIQKVRSITNRTKDKKKEEKESSIAKDQGPDRRAADTIEEGAGSGEDEAEHNITQPQTKVRLQQQDRESGDSVFWDKKIPTMRGTRRNKPQDPSNNGSANEEEDDTTEDPTAERRNEP